MSFLRVFQNVDEDGCLCEGRYKKFILVYVESRGDTRCVFRVNHNELRFLQFTRIIWTILNRQFSYKRQFKSNILKSYI